MRSQGKIKSYFQDRGFGFIKPHDGSADVFFHVSELDGAHVDSGDVVEFDITRDPKSGRDRAADVKLLEN